MFVACFTKVFLTFVPDLLYQLVCIPPGKLVVQVHCFLPVLAMSLVLKLHWLVVDLEETHHLDLYMLKCKIITQVTKNKQCNRWCNPHSKHWWCSLPLQIPLRYHHCHSRLNMTMAKMWWFTTFLLNLRKNESTTFFLSE